MGWEELTGGRCRVLVGQTQGAPRAAVDDGAKAGARSARVFIPALKIAFFVPREPCCSSKLRPIGAVENS
jgi:hypothetical protein